MKFINQVKYANTEQINLVNFKSSSMRMCQRRLQILSKSTKRHPNPPLRRDRYTINEPYYYYNASSKKLDQIEHILGVTWIVTWMIHKLSGCEKFYSFDREVKEYESQVRLRPDGLIGIENLMERTIDFTFIEFDIEESGNKFLKVPKYCNLKLSKAYMKSWWVSKTKSFPRILIVTTGNPRKIRDAIERDNSEGLDFTVVTLDQLKEECGYGRSSLRHL